VKVTASQTLLEEYACHGSESAFRELVTRYSGLVYSTALRLLGGDTHLAEDVAQKVFTDFARKARELSSEVILGGWLHQRACHVALSTMRADRRRQAREREAAQMNMPNDDPDLDLTRIAPILDEALARLGKQDRTAIILRFFERRDFRAIGEALGVTEDAARMRANRALDRLHNVLTRRGVTLPAAALGIALTSQSLTAVPAALAEAIAGSVLAGGVAGTGISTTLLKIIAMTKLKFTLISALVVAGAGVSLVVQNQNQARLRGENELLRQEAAQRSAENESLSNRLVQASGTPPDEQRLELLKLRGEVGVLKRQLAEAAGQLARAAKTPVAQAVSQPAAPAAQQKQMIEQRALGNAKMRYANGWMKAFTLYMMKNNSQFPATFDQVAAYLDNTNDSELLSATNLFDVVYQGPLAGITNPATTIVLRESHPVQLLDGQWSRAYGFADGHSSVAGSPDGNFQHYESQYFIAPATGSNQGPQ
jgi:RNA polymerase sigma factor (sigma-70 family)